MVLGSWLSGEACVTDVILSMTESKETYAVDQNKATYIGNPFKILQDALYMKSLCSSQMGLTIVELDEQDWEIPGCMPEQGFIYKHAFLMMHDHAQVYRIYI